VQDLIQSSLIVFGCLMLKLQLERGYIGRAVGGRGAGYG